MDQLKKFAAWMEEGYSPAKAAILVVSGGLSGGLVLLAMLYAVGNLGKPQPSAQTSDRLWFAGNDRPGGVVPVLGRSSSGPSYLGSADESPVLTVETRTADPAAALKAAAAQLDSAKAKAKAYRVTVNVIPAVE